jgi:Flp pilus assembly protein TadG
MRPQRPQRLLRPLRSAQRDRGSMAVEFVIAGPALVLLLLLVSAGGQWLDLTGDVSAAARDSVRAASFARQYNEASADALAAAQADLNGVCIGNEVKAPVSLYQGGAPVGDGDFANAQDVEVTVSCRASLKIFGVVGFPVSKTFTDTAAAPLDPFVDRG